MSTKFNMTKDVAGYNGFGVTFTDNAFSMILAVNTPQTVTVPSEYANYIAIITSTPGASIWVANNTTAAFPTGAAAATLSHQNPPGMQVKKGDVLSFVTNDATSPEVGVRFYVVPTFTN